MTQKACDKAVNRCFFVFDPIHDWCKTQERCDRLASEDLFNCILPWYIYIAQRMCDEAVNDSLAAMKRIPGFVC